MCFVLVLMLAGVPAYAASSARPILVQSRQFDVLYRVAASPEPLSSVELWYTTDRAETWHHAGEDVDRVSPFSFLAPHEGLLGLFIVLRNRFGESSPPPTRGTTPQEWAFVDFTPPVVQLHEARLDRTDDARRLLLRWSAWDANMLPRPVRLAYRADGEANWSMIADALANTGRFDWLVPDDVEGRIEIRLTVHDRGGHRSEHAISDIDVDRATQRDALAVSAETASESPKADPEPAPLPPSTAPVSAMAARRANELFEVGSFYLLRGDLDLAVQRFRDALHLDPAHIGARHDLAGVYYKQGLLRESIAAYETVLQRDPNHRSALQGLALAHAGSREYRAAQDRLATLLKLDPSNAKIWLHLGDTALMAGDALAARGYWMKALSVNPKDTETIRKATVRLQAPSAAMLLAPGETASAQDATQAGR